jgi:hypothetical protein
MGDRGVHIEGAQTSERHFVPLAIEALPVERRFPGLTLHGVPAIGQPVSEVTVATILNKCQVLAIGQETILENKILDKHPVRRLFIIETKTLGVVANIVRAAGKGNEVGCGL